MFAARTRLAMESGRVEGAVASSRNKYHLHLQLREREVARPMILTYSIRNLDFPKEYDLSVVGHELWHLAGTSATGPKRALLLEALRDELDSHPNMPFVEEFNRSLALLWEALAYEAQLRHRSTPEELAKQISATLEYDRGLAEIVPSTRDLINAITPWLKEPDDLRIDLVVGYLHECIDILGRLGVSPHLILQTFKENSKTLKTKMPTSKQSWTSFVVSSMLSSLPVATEAVEKVFRVIDVADPEQAQNVSLSGIRSSISHDFFVQDLRFFEDLTEILESDTSEALAKYVGANLDEFGVTSPIAYQTVDSLESATPSLIRTYVENPPPEAMFLRLQERISTGQIYARRWRGRLEKELLVQLSGTYMRFLRSLYDFSDDLVCPSERNIDDHRRMLYSKLRRLILFDGTI